jgi:hypothetical protein
MLTGDPEADLVSLELIIINTNSLTCTVGDTIPQE